MKLATSIALALTLSAGSAGAAVIAYDGFAYPPGALAPNGPGLGFGAPWIADPGVLVIPAGLSSPLDLPPMGGAVAGFFNYEAPLTASLGNKEFWASFLVQHTGGGNDQTYMGLTQFAIPFGNPPLVAFGIRLGQYGIFDAGSGFTPAATPFSPPGVTDFLVAHFEVSGGSYKVSLYVNPISGSVPVVVKFVPLIPYDAVSNQNQAQFTSDEVRIGDTAADVGFAQVTIGACCHGTQCTLTAPTACNDTYLGVGTVCTAVGRFGPVNLCCPADTDNSGTVTVQDLFNYLVAFFGHCLP